MKITVELPDEMGERIDLEARKDGHTNRNAVIRKVLNSFFAVEIQHSSTTTKENERQPAKAGA